MVEKINARDCILTKLTKEEANNFIDKYHPQKHVASLLDYGLTYNNELVQVMSFGKSRFNKFYSWEIIRDCTKDNCIVNGGVSKIWNYFIENNTVHSCICYSYPHNGDYTNKYVDYCGFKNIKKSKPQKKIYFEGVWNGEAKRIDKSILEHHGVDRLLKGDFGKDRSNEQILLDLGFEKKYEDGFSPQVDSYFPCGIVYKITDLDTGKFYIGETFKREAFEAGEYNGSGNKWSEYFKKYKDQHTFKREILKSDFDTPKDLYKYEIEEIHKYCDKLENGKYKVNESTGCMNKKTTAQPELPICPECGGLLFRHYKTCSEYKAPKACPKCGATKGHYKTCSEFKQTSCPECGGKGGHHYSTCSQYKPTDKACPECGQKTNHAKTCSHYKETICQECGAKNGRHFKTCSQYKAPEPCPECGGVFGHKLGCSKYVPQKSCPECGGNTAHHEKWCSHYKESKICPECGGKGGKHKGGCSKAKRCEECGNPLYSHKITCSKYKKKNVKTICEECGGKGGHHFITCSKYKEHKKNPPCPECGGKRGHYSTCSKYKGKICKECGNPINDHKTTCSRYREKIIYDKCPECGTTTRMHKKGCSHYEKKKMIKACPECGATAGHHFKTCSKYKPRTPCPECGSLGASHRKGCSKFTQPKHNDSTTCPECGGKAGHHKSFCSKRKTKAK